MMRIRNVGGTRSGRRLSSPVRRATLLVALALLMAGCGWSQYRAGPAGNGYNPGETAINVGNVAQLEPAWSKDLDWAPPDLVSSPQPLVRAGTDLVVAVPTSANSVLLDAETGALRRNLGTLPDENAAIVDGRIFLDGDGFANPGGRLVVSDLATGTQLWFADHGFEGAAPVIAGDLVYSTTTDVVGAHSKSLQARRVTDGKILFDLSSCCGYALAPSVAYGTLYWVQTSITAPKVLSAFNATTGAVRWSVPLTHCPESEATAVAGGRVYVGGSAFDAATGAHLWDWPRCSVTGAGTITPMTLYAPYHPQASTTALQAIDAATGAEGVSIPWGQNADGKPSAPAAANGLLFGADGHNLIALNAATGQRLWTSPASTGTFSDPIVSNGMVYALSTDGAVYAFGLPG